MFPFIYKLDDLLPHIQHKPEITVKKHPNGCTVVCYAIATPTTFDTAYSRECRGISFDPDGDILMRTMHKFFNVGEREETQMGLLPWNDVVRAMDKRDGSMISATMFNEKILCKTKKSFDTIQALRATEFIEARKNYIDFVCKCTSLSATPIFEWTSPEDRIVLKYLSDDLVLLHVRENFSGRYYSQAELEKLTNEFAIPLVQVFQPNKNNIESILNNIATEELKEGYIFQFGNDEMVKLKTPWYINLHHSVTFTRERDIVRMILDETVDDFKSYLTSIGESHSKVESIEKRVTDTLTEISSTVISYVHENNIDDVKTFVEQAKGQKYFSLIMDQYRGRDITGYVKKYFVKHHLKSYSLETV